MADLGFLPAVTTILDQTAPDGQRMLFSATLDRGVDKLVRAYLKDPALHAVATSSSHIDAMEHRVFTLQSEDKVAVITELAARPGSHADLRADQARCRPAGDAVGPWWRACRGHPRQPQAERAAACARRIRRRPPAGARRDRCRCARHPRRRRRPGRALRPAERLEGLPAPVGPDGARRRQWYRVVARAARRGSRCCGFAQGRRRYAESVDVHPGHQAVRELAASGEPVVVRVMPRRETQTTTSRPDEPVVEPSPWCASACVPRARTTAAGASSGRARNGGAVIRWRRADRLAASLRYSSTSA